MTNEDNDTVNELISKHLAGEASADERQRLFTWIKADQANRRYFDDYKKAFDIAEQHLTLTQSENTGINIDREWDHFKAAAGIARSGKQLSQIIWLRIAATVLVILGISGVLYYYTAKGTGVYQTAGNKQTVDLPDGSQVTLNRNTTLSYDSDFGDDNRTVKLKGEAFFNVEPDAGKPFIVLTEKSTVRVVGTSFNVNAYDSLTETEVIVKTGIVSLETKEGDQKVKLTAGQKGTYSKSVEKITSTLNDDVNFQSWDTQHLVFDENDLHTVVAALKKTYNADITISTDVPSVCVVTVTFDHQTLESVLRVLERTLNLKYTINGNRIEITEAGC